MGISASEASCYEKGKNKKGRKKIFKSSPFLFPKAKLAENLREASLDPCDAVHEVSASSDLFSRNRERAKRASTLKNVFLRLKREKSRAKRAGPISTLI